MSTLSGGERFRATLAALLLAEPAPQLLLLDEPTNSLDIASMNELIDASLRSHRQIWLLIGYARSSRDSQHFTTQSMA